MRSFNKPKPLIYALLLLFAFLVNNPALAVNGNLEAAQKAWPMIESGFLLIDVRTEDEFQASHIDGAINIEWDNFEALEAAIGTDKQRPVVLYCRSGNRSGKAINELKVRGYGNLYNATGLEALEATKP